MNRFSADVERYKSRGYKGKELWLNPAVWSIGCYRLSNWLHVARPTTRDPNSVEGGLFFCQ